jgi:hypothetical protein
VDLPTFTPAAFHLEYLPLFGVYLAGLWLLADTAFGLRRLERTLLFLVLVVTTFRRAAPGRGRLFGETWEYLWDGASPGQRLGPVFQPSTFGAFLLLSLGSVLRGRATGSRWPPWLPPSIRPTCSATILVLATCLVLWRRAQPPASRCWAP